MPERQQKAVLEPGAVRWLPIGRRPVPRPRMLKRIAPLWSGDAFVRTKLGDRKGEGLDDPWDRGMPPAMDCKPPKTAETARHARILRQILPSELPSANTVMHVEEVTCDPGRFALHGVQIDTGYDRITGAAPAEPGGGVDHWQPASKPVRTIPIGALLADYRRVRHTHPAGHAATGEVEGGWWRAWRVGPKGGAWLEWEGPDPRLGDGWAAEIETPQERLARLLDEYIHIVFQRRIAALERDKSPAGRVKAAEERMAVLFWAKEVEKMEAERAGRRRRRRAGRQ